MKGLAPAALLVVGLATAALAGANPRDCPHCPEMVAVAPGSVVLAEGRPTRHLRIAYTLAYSRDKVSTRDWKQCVLAGVCQGREAGGTAGLDPVVHVSWIDVQQYLLWLNLETGLDYRLLSETEWEYLTARAAPGLGAAGLEWTSDCWHADRAEGPTDGSSWDADGDCRYHVARGRRPAEPASSRDRRYRFLFDARDAGLGFRVARTLRD